MLPCAIKTGQPEWISGAWRAGRPFFEVFYGVLVSMLLLLVPVGFAQQKTSAGPTRLDATISLIDVLRLAEENNLELQAARKSLDLSRLDIDLARQIPNPQYVGNYSVGKVVTVQSNPQQFSLNQVFETAGKRGKRTEVARARFLLAQMEYNERHWDLRFRVRKAYADLIAAVQGLDNLQIQTTLLDKLAEIAKKRFQAGAAPQSEVLQAELARAQMEIHVNEAQAQVRQARYQLNSLVGENLPAGFEPVENDALKISTEKTELAPEAQLPLPVRESLYNKAYEARADLKAAMQEKVVSQSLLRLIQAQRVPDLELLGGWLIAPTPLDGGGARWYSGAFLQTTVDLPIFHNRQTEISKVRTSLSQNDLQIRDVQRRIRLDIDSAYAQLEASRDNIALFQNKLIPSERKFMDLSQSSYESGKIPLAEVILAEQFSRQLMAEYLDVVVEYQSTWGALEKAVGIPMEDW